MELMANSLSNDVCSNELPLVFGKNERHIPSMAPSSSATAEAAANNNREIPSSYVETCTSTHENGISNDDHEDVIDSALLCAMRDGRERVALLRLEQTMVDFIKEETMGYIEVGGPANCIVMCPNGGTILGGSGKQGNPPSSSEQAAGRQTSFQRCWLHRLADRFGIIRENTLDGMIRLVKVKDSAIPKRLLIDLDPSEYAIEGKTNVSDADVRGLATKLSDSSIGQRKMKIMKRSSSGLGSSSSLKSEGKGTSARNRKNLSDKEKAYAEARARIFNGGTGSTTDSVAVAPVADSSEMAATKPSAMPTQAVQPPSTPPPSLDQTDGATEDKQAAAVNKATWRNQRQEQSDPDFQRLAGPQSSMHYGGDAYGQQTSPMYGYNPQQQHFYPSPQPYATGHAYGNAGVTTARTASAPYAASSVSAVNSYAGAAVYAAPDAETYHPAPPSSPYYRGRSVRSLSRQSSSSLAGDNDSQRAADVNNLHDFPSL